MSPTLSASWTLDMAASCNIDRSRCIEYVLCIDSCQCKGIQMGRAASAAPARSSECCASVLAAPLDSGDAAELARAFSALADPVRLRVLSILAASPQGEVCVCDFVEPLAKSQ